MQTINDRVEELIKHLGLNPNQFAKLIGKPRQNVYKMLDRGTNPSYDLIQAIISCTNVSTEWLINGTGTMFKGEEIPKHSLPETIDLDHPHKPDEEFIKGKHLRILPITVDPSGRENIVFVPARAAAGYPIEHSDPVFIQKLPHFNLPSNKFKAGTFRAFEVSGDSMVPAVLPGSWVIGSYVEDWGSIKDGHVYIIVDNEGVRVKRVLNRIKERSQLSLQSDNPEHYTRQVDIENVFEVWRLEGELRFQFKKTSNQTAIDVINLKTAVQELTEDLKKLQGKNNNGNK